MSNLTKKLFHSYTSSTITLIVLTVFTESILTAAIKYTMSYPVSLLGTWIEFIAFLFFTWSWANPTLIVAWAGVGIDTYPDNKAKVLVGQECKNYSIWVQPNKLKSIIASTTLTYGALLQALGQTFE